MSKDMDGQGQDQEQVSHTSGLEKDTIYLTLEDESKLKCQVVKIFEVEAKEYIAVFPQGGQSVFLYGYENTKEGPELSSIEDDSEYARVVEYYEGMLE